MSKKIGNNVKNFGDFFNEKSEISPNLINEFFGGRFKDQMNPIVQKLIDYLQKYKEDINKENSSINNEDTIKIENMSNYIIHNIDLDTISSSNRLGKKVRGEGETISKKIKRSLKNF